MEPEHKKSPATNEADDHHYLRAPDGRDVLRYGLSLFKGYFGRTSKGLEDAGGEVISFAMWPKDLSVEDIEALEQWTSEQLFSRK